MNNMRTDNIVLEDLAHGAGCPPVSASTEPMVASYLTHELRAPLTSIVSAMMLLQETLAGVLKPDQSRLLELALKNGERLGQLINDILDFNKIQSGKMKLQTCATPARKLIRESVDSLNAWAVTKGIKLLRVPPEELLPRVQADPQRAVQVLINLISNAIKFTPSGGQIEIFASLGRGEHEGTVVFTVKDNGCGIAPADLERIFQCFEQSASGAKSGQGTGLGLTLAKAMVELHGGRIWAESRRGLGSAFHFTIPIAPQDMHRKVALYPQPVQYHGIFVHMFRRISAFIATFV